MRKLLIILFTLIAAGAWAQSNPNSGPIAYETITQAIKGTKSRNWKVSVTDAITGGNFTVKRRSEGYVPNGGTIIAMADSASVLVRDISTSIGIKLKWFLKGDGVTDNAAKMNWLVSTASPFNHFIAEAGDNFYCSQAIVPQKPIFIEGPDGYEMAAGTVFFSFPQKCKGFVINPANSKGTKLTGFTTQAPLPRSGRILEYNPNDGAMLYISPITGILAGDTLEFRDPYFLQTSGTAIVTNAGISNISKSITFYLPIGTFNIGDVVTGSTSGATATVRFVSTHFNAVAVGAITGTFKLGETITGSISGATATFLNVPGGTSFTFAKVATVSNVTGSPDAGNTTSLKRQNIFILKGYGGFDGITANRRATLEDLTVYGFDNGLNINSATTPVSNANLCRLTKINSQANAGNGIRLDGGDGGNHSDIINSTFVSNCGYGIMDNTFLGITSNTVHTSLNMVGGFYTGTYINRKSLLENPYSEAGYNVMQPWLGTENQIGGSSVKIGGTDGLPNNVPYWSTSSNSGATFENNEIRNNIIYTTPGSGDKGIVFKSQGTVSHPLWVTLMSTPGVGRGPAIAWGTPYGSGTQGADIRNTFIYMGDIQATTNSASAYAYAFKLRRNAAPAITVTGAGGSGAILQPEMLGGKVVGVNVLAGGANYPVKATTATMAGLSNTTLIPIVEDGIITSVQVSGDSLTTNKDNDIYSVAELDGNGTFRPTTGSTGGLGDATHHWKYANIDSLVTNAGAASIPTRLIAKDAGGATALEMASLIATGNGGVGRGTLMGFTTPLATGTSAEIVQIGGIWGSNSHGTLVFNVGDDSASMTEKMRVNSLGYVGIGTTTPSELLEITRNVGGVFGSLRFAGGSGRDIAAYQNGAAANLNLIGTAISIQGTLQMSAQKQIWFTDYAGTNTGYAKIAASSTGTFDFAVNSILAQSFTSTGRALYGAPINPKAYTVATLPAGNQGDVAVVTDALNPANGATLVGGGAVKVMAFYNGTNWTAVGATTSSTARTLTVSAASTLALAYSIDYVYTGTVDGTYTLPAINSNTGSAYTIRIFNKSTHNLYINTNAGGSDIYGSGSGSTPSLILAPGASANLLPDGTSFDDIK